MAPTSVLLESGGDEESTSLIYAVLPPLIKRSVPKVRSLRRSLSSYNCAAALVGHSARSSPDSARPGSATPPPPYQEPIGSLVSILSDDEHDRVSSPSRRPLALDPSIFSDSERAGIKWEFASQGLSLLTLSAQGSSSLSSNPDFSRQLYIDSVSYLLRGLPHELSEEERLRLRAAIPHGLVPPQPVISRPKTRSQSQEDHFTQAEGSPTVLHRIVAMVVLQFFLLFSFLWPYVQSICRSAYEYERDHHVSERVLSQSWTAANVFSKNTMTIARTVCNWNDGQVGAALEDVVFWWVQGVTGGLREGVKGGMEVFGVQAVDGRGKRPARSGTRGRSPNTAH